MCCKAAGIPGGAALDGAVGAGSRVPKAASTHGSSTGVPAAFCGSVLSGPVLLLGSPQLREMLHKDI